MLNFIEEVLDRPVRTIAKVALVAAAILGPIMGMVVSNHAAAERDRYQPVTGRVVDEAPAEVMVARDGTVFKAFAADELGERVQVTVDRDARKGDQVTLYRDTEGGGLYRPSGAANDPYTEAFWVAVGFTALGAFAVAAVAFFLALAILSWDDRRPRRRRYEATF